MSKRIRRFHRYSLLTISCLLGTWTGVSAQTPEVYKFVVSAGDTVVIQNDYGRVRVQGTDDSVAEVQVRKFAAQASQLQNISVIAQQSGPRVFVSSFFYEYQAESVYIDLLIPRTMNVVVWGANTAVELTALSGGVHVFTQTGLITATDLTSSVSLTTGTGDLLFRTRVQPWADIRLESIQGRVRCHLAAGLNLRGWVRAGQQLSWNNEVNMQRAQLERQIGVGGPLLLASSLYGSVSVDLDLTLSDAQAVALKLPPSPTNREPSSTGTTSPDSSEPLPRDGSTGDRGTAPVILRPETSDQNDRSPSAGTGTTDPSSQEEVDYTTQPDGTVDSGYSLRVNVNWTYLNVSVRDRTSNRSVPNLTRDDFLVYEDEQLQQVERLDSTEAPFSLLLLLDVSGSTKDSMDLIQDASIEFTRQIKPNDRIAVAAFNSRSRLIQDFTNDRQAVARSISRLRSGGGTAFYDALETSINYYMQGMEGRKAIVVFSDGVDNQLTGDRNDGSQTTFRELYRDIQEVDTIIYTIFLSTDRYAPRRGPSRNGGSVVDILEDIMRGRVPNGPLGDQQAYPIAKQQMQSIADQTGGRMYAPQDIYDLRNVYSEIADDLRVQYTLAYNSTNAVNDGSWREIRVKIRNRNDLAARTRRGYYSKARP